jgi:ferrous iron transport protein B
VLAGLRRGIAAGLVMEASGPPRRRSTEPSLTRRIDSVMLNRYLGFPIFALIMYLAFWLTFRASAPLEGIISGVFGLLSSGVVRLLPEGPLQSLISDGVIGGVGGVLLYVPGIAVLFLAISLMEDTGYMARAAFLTDGLMHRFGLHGRSFIPMLLGFGCTVPAVLAARTLESRRDRLATILVLPLLSCGARLPVYLLVIRAFFPGRQPLVLFLVYGLGIALALLGARLLRKTILAGDDSPFVMELPPYRLPTARALSRHVWGRVSHYLAKAGTVILAFSVGLWLLGYFPRPAPGTSPAEALEASFSGRMGHALEPLVEPLGFDWRIATAMVGAMGAKELFVSQMAILSSLGDAGESGLSAELASRYDPGTGIAIIVFILISAPCLATVVMVRRETGSWWIALSQYALLTLLAWVAAFSARALLG